MEDERLAQDMRKEINWWRNKFLEDRFSESYKFIPKIYKDRLTAYFLEIPSDSFKSGDLEWDNCISTLLQYLGEKEK